MIMPALRKVVPRRIRTAAKRLFSPYQGAKVLFYHGVELEIVDSRIQKIHISFDQFEKQIHYLRENFEIISLDYLHECLADGHPISASQALLTFDDGYKSVATVVEPFLASLGVPFSLFISTRYISDGSRLPTYCLRAALFSTKQDYINIPCIDKKLDIRTEAKRTSANRFMARVLKEVPQSQVERIVADLIAAMPEEEWLEVNNRFLSDEPLNWEDVEELHNSGVTIGSHCHDHSILNASQHRGEVDYQLRTSKRLIEKRFGSCDYLAYPNGAKNDVTAKALSAVTENDYILAFATVPGEVQLQCNPYLLPRIYGGKEFEEVKMELTTGFRHNSSYLEWSSMVTDG